MCRDKQSVTEVFYLHDSQKTGRLWLFLSAIMRRHYLQIMVAERQKKRFSSFRRLACLGNKEKDERDERELDGPLAIAVHDSDGDGAIFPPFEEIYNKSCVDLDESICSYDVPPEPVGSPSEATAWNCNPAPTRRSSFRKSSRRPSSGTVPKRWHGDGGEDQPLQTVRFDEAGNARSSPSPKAFTSPPGAETPQIPSFVNASSKSSISPASVADSLGLDMESLSNMSLIKRVEVVKERAEMLLKEAKQRKQSRRSCSASVKSMASSVLTEPTVEGTSSGSSKSQSTLSEKIKRLRETKSRLQRFSDDYSDTSSLASEVRGLDRSSFFKMNDSSFLEGSQCSSDEDTIPEGSKHLADGGDVLHILSMLEAINGYDLSLTEHTLDNSTALDLDLSFLKA